MKSAYLCALILVNTLSIAGETPKISDFSWRGTLTVPAGVSVAKVEIPVSAMLHMKSRSLNDMRVFNSAGESVSYAIMGESELNYQTPVSTTSVYKAYQLFTPGKIIRSSQELTSVQIEILNSSAIVKLKNNNLIDNPDKSGQPLQAALFDMRSEKQMIDGLKLEADLPKNTLIHINAAISSDLKNWIDIPNKGPLFKFDGDNAPLNTIIEFNQTLQLQGQYLRLSWTGQNGVKVQTLTGRVSSSLVAPTPLRYALPSGKIDGNSISWNLPFAAHISALHLQTLQDNTLVPIYIQGRSDATQTWRTLISSVVYRINNSGIISSNPPTPLSDTSVNTLRVQASQGVSLPVGGLQATVEFKPVQVAFLASGTGPFTLAIGRDQTTKASVNSSLLSSVAKIDMNKLPLATMINEQIQSVSTFDKSVTEWLPEGTSLRRVMLWAVLVFGVLALGGVAHSLMRQMKSHP